MMTCEPIAVVGIGPAGAAELCEAARRHIERAEVLVGGRRHLDYFPGFSGQRIVLNGDLVLRVMEIATAAETQKTVVLASGDPLYFGIGRALLETFGKDDLVFFPHLSSVQLAFARLKETWHDACVISLHGRPLHTLLPALQRGEPKIALLTDAANDPYAICRQVCVAGFADQYALWVCEDLGGPGERITQLSLGNPAEMSFSPLNVVILVRWGTADPGAGLPPLLGIPDFLFEKAGDDLARAKQMEQLNEAMQMLVEHRLESLRRILEPRGMITKREVRLLSLCHLELRPDDVCWDIGAGSGSVSIEAARLSPRLAMHAIEKDADACRFLTDNVHSFGLANIHVVHGDAPGALNAVPDPDAIFIGGSGGRLIDILAAGMQRLRRGGRLVLNCIALESLSQAWTWLKEQGFEPEVVSVQIARSRPLGSLHCLEPEHPISIVKARKQ